MYGVLSKHLELVRRGSDLNLNDIIEDMRNSFDDKITDAFILAKISLIHSEISEASYYVTNPAKDKHLNEYNGFDVEMADALIRILDICERYDIDIETISKYKFEYNKKEWIIHWKIEIQKMVRKYEKMFI